MTSLEFPQLPIQLITSDKTCDNWQLVDSQREILDTLRVSTLGSAHKKSKGLLRMVSVKKILNNIVQCL